MSTRQVPTESRETSTWVGASLSTSALQGGSVVTVVMGLVAAPGTDWAAWLPTLGQLQVPGMQDGGARARIKGMNAILMARTGKQQPDPTKPVKLHGLISNQPELWPQ